MEPTGVERKLAAILAARLQDYDRLMAAGEEATLSTLSAYRKIIEGLVARHDGRVVGAAGDSVLAEFGGALDAARSAVAIQEELAVRNAGLADERKMRFGIGIDLGDVTVEGNEPFGDGVDVAARLVELAEPGGICVSGDVYDQVKHELALDFEDMGPKAVKNIAEPVRVYQIRIEPGTAVSRVGRRKQARRHWPVLAGAVVVLVAVAAAALWQTVLRPAPAPEEVASKSATALPLPDRRSIAVLPFANMSGDEKQEYFSDGITDDLITDLAKISGLFVVTRNAVFRYKGKAVAPDQVSRELGVQYVLVGGVRKTGDLVRLAAQLIDAATDRRLWAGRYERNLKDIFALEDEIAQGIAAALGVRLTEGEKEQVTRRYTDDPEAYDSFLRAMEYYRLYTRETTAEARRRLERVIGIDPKFALAYARLSYIRYRQWASRWSEDPEALERALELAQKAVALDDSLPEAHERLGFIYLFKRRHEQAIAELERAIALDPNDAKTHARLGQILSMAGRPKQAIPLAKKAMRLNPHDYHAWYRFVLGRTYYLTGRYEEAIASLKRSVARNPNFVPAHRYLAAIYGELGRKDEARAEVAEILRLHPRATVENLKRTAPWKDRKALQRFLDGLSKAGLPEKSRSAPP